MKNLVGRRMTKEVAFLGEAVTIQKLSVKEVKEIQELLKTVDLETEPLKLVQGVIRIGVVGAVELTDDDFDEFPPDELNNLVTEVLKFSGIAGDVAAAEAATGN